MWNCHEHIYNQAVALPDLHIVQSSQKTPLTRRVLFLPLLQHTAGKVFLKVEAVLAPVSLGTEGLKRTGKCVSAHAGPLGGSSEREGLAAEAALRGVPEHRALLLQYERWGLRAPKDWVLVLTLQT